ncbi:hypothetical protein ACTXT7_002864 [Hymenolepis weldensis]
MEGQNNLEEAWKSHSLAYFLNPSLEDCSLPTTASYLSRKISRVRTQRENELLTYLEDVMGKEVQIESQAPEISILSKKTDENLNQ